MKTLRLLLIPILCSAVLTAACGDDPANTTNNSQNPNALSLDDFIAEVARARATKLCHAAFECPQSTSPETVIQLGRLGNQTACIQHFEYQIAQSSFPDIKASVTAGRTKYDASQAPRCLSALNTDAQKCTFSLATTEQACEAVFIATLDVGDACTTSTECLNATCLHGQFGDTCPGTCTPDAPVATLGQSCAETACEPNLRCSYTQLTADDEPTCIAPSIAAKGEDCTDFETICQSPLICSFMTGICVDPPTYATLDQPCNPAADTHCRAGLACSISTQTCQPLRQPNQACQSTHECTAGLYCDTTCLPLKSLNEPCDNNQESTLCTIGLRCLPNAQTGTSTCQDPHQSHQSCEI